MPASRSPYRWVVVAAASVGLAGAYGGISTISILIGPLEGEFGWLRADVAFAYTLVTLGAAFGGLAIGRLADRLPPAPIAAAGVLVVGAGLALVAHASSIRTIQAIYLTLGLLGFSCLYTPLIATVSLWFERKAGVALGIVTAGGAIGQAVVPPVFQALVSAHGWRAACALFAVGFVTILLPAVLLVRRPARRASSMSAAAASDWPVKPAFSVALLAAAALFCCLLMGVPSVHLVAFATDEGTDPDNAVRVVTLLMLMGAAGRLATGAIVDRLGPLPTYALVSAVQTAAVMLFPAALGGVGVWAVAAIYGFGFGGVMTALVCAVRAAVPARNVGSAMAFVSLLAWLGMGAGGYGGGLCFDMTGSYQLSFMLAGLAGFANLAALALLAGLVHLRGPRPFAALMHLAARRGTSLALARRGVRVRSPLLQ
jgi:MFS family permease